MGVCWGFIGVKSDLIIETRYITVSDFLEGKSIVQCKESNSELIIDKKGDVVGEYNNYSVKTDEYTIDRTSIRSGDDYEIKFIYKDINGNKVLPAQPHGYYDTAGKFINGIALVNNRLFINKKGETVFKVKLGKADLFSEGYSAVTFATTFGFINSQNFEVVPLEYDLLREFSDGLVYGEKDGCKYFINTEGKKVFKVDFDFCRDFFEGLCAISLDKNWGFIDKTGVIVIDLIYDEVRNFSEGFALHV